ncbi:hypothetical protein PanWU01x14_057430 [Parasponia andersonii]|uniref:Uncharacterized protein n=1 Tax=Parasponia andersonii TaxID=3476 RepID=A0A2P5DJU0_PARAD|nr:hypothetical protein PanWU01x14_057430 [Parasponia andersonii]
MYSLIFLASSSCLSISASSLLAASTLIEAFFNPSSKTLFSSLLRSSSTRSSTAPANASFKLKLCSGPPLLHVTVKTRGLEEGEEEEEAAWKGLVENVSGVNKGFFWNRVLTGFGQ